MTREERSKILEDVTHRLRRYIDDCIDRDVEYFETYNAEQIVNDFVVDEGEKVKRDWYNRR